PPPRDIDSGTGKGPKLVVPETGTGKLDVSVPENGTGFGTGKRYRGKCLGPRLRSSRSTRTRRRASSIFGIRRSMHARTKLPKPDKRPSRRHLPRNKQIDLAWAAHERAEAGLHRYLRMPRLSRVSSSHAAPTFVSCFAPHCGHSKRSELEQMRARV